MGVETATAGRDDVAVMATSAINASIPICRATTAGCSRAASKESCSDAQIGARARRDRPTSGCPTVRCHRWFSTTARTAGDNPIFLRTGRSRPDTSRRTSAKSLTSVSAVLVPPIKDRNEPVGVRGGGRPGLSNGGGVAQLPRGSRKSTAGGSKASRASYVRIGSLRTSTAQRGRRTGCDDPW